RGRRGADRPRRRRGAAVPPGRHRRRAAARVRPGGPHPHRPLPRRRDRERREGRSMSTQQSPRTGRTGTFAAIGMVARREVKARFFTKSNLISLGILLVVIVAGIVVLDYFVNRDDEDAADYTVAVDGSVSVLEPQLTAAGDALGTTIDVEELGRADAVPRLGDDLDAYLS